MSEFFSIGKQGSRDKTRHVAQSIGRSENDNECGLIGERKKRERERMIDYIGAVLKQAFSLVIAVRLFIFVFPPTKKHPWLLLLSFP